MRQKVSDRILKTKLSDYDSDFGEGRGSFKGNIIIYRSCSFFIALLLGSFVTNKMSIVSKLSLCVRVKMHVGAPRSLSMCLSLLSVFIVSAVLCMQVSISVLGLAHPSLF